MLQDNGRPLTWRQKAIAGVLRRLTKALLEACHHLATLHAVEQDDQARKDVTEAMAAQQEYDGALISEITWEDEPRSCTVVLVGRRWHLRVRLDAPSEEDVGPGIAGLAE